MKLRHAFASRECLRDQTAVAFRRIASGWWIDGGRPTVSMPGTPRLWNTG